MNNETVAETTRRAYVLGYKMLDTAMDEESIYAKIEKQNVPEAIAKQVAADIILERQKRDFKAERPNFYFAIVIVSIAIIAAIVTAIFTDYIFLCIGFILTGAIYITRYYNKKPKA